MTLSAIIVIRSNAHQRGGDFIAHLPKLRQSRKRRQCGRFGKTWHALDDLGTDGEGRRCFDLRADLSLDRSDFAGQLLQKARVSLLNKGRRLMLLLAFPDGL